MPRTATTDDALLSSDVDTDFGTFYERHADLVVAYFARRTEFPDQVLDLVAETFARALSRRHQFDPSRGPAIAWLLGIAKNLLFDTYKQGQVAADTRRRLAMEPIELDDPGLRAVEQRIGIDLDRVLRRLPEEQREAVQRRVIAEEPYADIARAFGCSEHVVRKRVSRGLTTLRKTLRSPS